MSAEHWCLELICADEVLRWLLLFLLAGAVFWSVILHILSRGFLGAPTVRYPEGKLFSILRLQLPFSHTAFRKFLEQLPAKSLKPVRWSLWIDFLFMAFVYPLLACCCWYLLRHAAPVAAPGDNGFCSTGWLRIGIWLSFAAWLMDILENVLLFACLKHLSWFRSRALLLAALLKWGSVLCIVIILLATVLKGC